MSWTVKKIHSQHGVNGKMHVVCVLEGEEPLSDDLILVRPTSQLDHPMMARSDCPLSSKELETLIHLAQGKVYKQIAKEMHLSVSTVRTHLHNTYKKIQVSDRAQAVLKAYREGWITVELSDN